MSNLADELRVALRGLRRSPGFTALAVTSLALAIGANTTVFTLVDTVLLARLPLPEPDRLVQAWEERPARGWSRFGVSAPAFEDWRVELRSVASLAAFARRSANVAGPERPRRVEILEATADVFAVLGLSPRLGRTFLREEETAGRDRVVVLAFDFWRDAFASDPAVVGRAVTLDGVPHVIAGVLPLEARSFDDAQVWRPLRIGTDGQRGARWLEVIGRLRPGASVAVARAELAVLALRHAREFPDTNNGWTATVVPLLAVRGESSRPLLVALSAAVVLVLLIACANVGGLMLARGAERHGELAVRAALGAQPARLARLMAMESIAVAILGGVAGTLLAAVSGKLVAAAVGGALPATATAVVDARAVLFTALATLVTGMAFGLAPALHARRVGLEPALRGAGRGGTPSRLRARRVLVSVELALAVTLIAAAGLLVRSVHGLLAVDPGFEPAEVLAMRVAPPQSRPRADEGEDAFVRLYLAERDRMTAFYDDLLERVQGLPGVQAAGAVNRLPLTGRWWTIGFTAEGQREPVPGESPSASGRVVTPGYFQAMRIPLRAGRLFDGSDRASSSPGVTIVSESLARRVWPNQDPIGRRLTIDQRHRATVVGVVGDVRLEGLDVAAPAVLYVPFAQATFGLFPDWGLDLVVRAHGEAEALVTAVRDQVGAMDPTLPVFAVRRLDDVVSGSVAARKAALTLLTAFAALAAALAAVGLYGVVSQSARQRTREIGVRLALGAQRRDICRMVLGEGLALALAGGALGLALAAAAGRLVASLLFAVRPGDPATLLGASGVLAVMAVSASLAPALRASRADPVEALRNDP